MNKKSNKANDTSKFAIDFGSTKFSLKHSGRKEQLKLGSDKNTNSSTNNINKGSKQIRKDLRFNRAKRKKKEFLKLFSKKRKNIAGSNIKLKLSLNCIF